MNDQSATHVDFSVAYYSGDRKTGAITLVTQAAGERSVEQIPLGPASGAEAARKPVFIGLTEDRRVILLDPVSKALRFENDFPVDAFPAHIYSDPQSTRDWFMNDGDKGTGNDTLNCGAQGSSVTAVDNTSSETARFLKTICVGRGHHQAAYSYPADTAPQVPRRAWISSLKDGTISVIGNEPDEVDSYLRVIATIDLCEPEREQDGRTAAPNNAFPHGLAYSPVTGKMYNLNNGYGTVAVIDPLTHAIERRIALKGYSNLFATPDGRYLIARGADRKSDSQHVIAKMAVLDVNDLSVCTSLELPDIYLSKYYFNPEGSKLYFTAGSSGSPEQQANIKADALLVFDLAALPAMPLSGELRLGVPAGSVDFHATDGHTQLVFASTAENGTLSVIDGARDTLLEQIPVADPVSHSRVWVLPA